MKRMRCAAPCLRSSASPVIAWTSPVPDATDAAPDATSTRRTCDGNMTSEDAENETKHKLVHKSKTFTSNKSHVSSNLSFVYICLSLLLITEILFSVGLFLYISNVDKKYSKLMPPDVRREHVEVSRKRRSAVVEDNTVNPASSGGVDANVEFFNPKLRQELEDKDMSKKKASGGEGETANNPWVWLTSYSRIPLVAIQGFCSATRDYCPPGPPGSPGLPGSAGQRGADGNKGDRGDRGFPGEEGKRGATGNHGEPGPRGPEGEGGSPGTSGLDGRDGVPGEPGLDGIPGRNGLDGIPAMDGLPGLNGIPGTPGTNGSDGRPGLLGPPGPLGPKGPRGMTGPRGRPGKSGINGMPGIPGINAWTVKINGTTSSELLIPPSIAGSVPMMPQQPQLITVREGDNVRLRCAATGTPLPNVYVNMMCAGSVPMMPQQPQLITVREGDNVRLRCAATGTPLPNVYVNMMCAGSVPMMPQQPQLITVREGDNVRLRCAATGTPLPNVYVNMMCAGSVPMMPQQPQLITVREGDNVRLRCAATGTPLPNVYVNMMCAGSVPMMPQQPQLITVREGDNVRLRCAATGTPLPNVEWRKLDPTPIPLGAWKTVSVSGHTLNITRINREHMGSYLCIADNGVPPQTNQTFKLEVHFPPMIHIQNQIVGAVNGSTAVLECDVQAYPEAVRYWERSDGRLLEPGDKYRMRYQELGRYQGKMTLNLTRFSAEDAGQYHCICKNELGITKGIFTLQGIDPSFARPPTVTNTGVGLTYGPLPPDLVDIEDLCPPPKCPDCPDAKEFKCQDGGISLFNLVKGMEIRAFENGTFTGLPNRTLDCQLYAVGKPVYHNFTDANYGSWMRDALPRSEATAEKYWMTKEDEPYHLYEYANKSVYRKGIYSNRYRLTLAFKGNAHVVYNGSFYYNERDQPRILRFDLDTKNEYQLDVPQVATNGTNFLYTTKYNYMDFSVDDNGLWVVYGLPNLNNTIVMKVDSSSMKTQYMWNISVNHHKVGEMFIVCGVLYAVDSCTDRNTKIRFALDLYKNILLDVNLAFTNPFLKTTMIGYNHRNKELYSWDKGNQLTYPIRYHDIGYNMTKEEKGEPEANAQVATGYDVYN